MSAKFPLIAFQLWGISLSRKLSSVLLRMPQRQFVCQLLLACKRASVSEVCLFQQTS